MVILYISVNFNKYNNYSALEFRVVQQMMPLYFKDINIQVFPTKYLC